MARKLSKALLGIGVLGVMGIAALPLATSATTTVTGPSTVYSDLEIVATIGQSISLTLSTDVLDLGELIPSGSINSEEMTATVTTNASSGFHLDIASVTTTDMVHDTNPTTPIPTVGPVDRALDSIVETSAWGWRIPSMAANIFSGTQVGANSRIYSASGATYGTDVDVTFGAWAAGDQAAGEYRTIVRFTALVQ